MLAKTTDKSGVEWDERLPYVLFAYRASQQSSTCESPFFLVYGCDPRLPVPDALCAKKSRMTVDLKEYGIELHQKMSAAWELARQSVKRAQRRQKDYYDRWATALPFRVGERAFLYKPMEKTGEARKLARPFHGPYRIQEMGTNTATIVCINQPEGEPLLVSLERLRRCPKELGNECWPAGRGKRRRKVDTATKKTMLLPQYQQEEPTEPIQRDSMKGGDAETGVLSRKPRKDTDTLEEVAQARTHLAPSSRMMVGEPTSAESHPLLDYEDASPYSAEVGEEPQLGSPSTENGGEDLPTERAGGPGSHKWSRRLRPRDKLHPPERVAQLAVTEEGSPVVDDHHPLAVCVRDYRVREQSEVPVEQNREDEPRTTRPQQGEM